MAQSEIYIKGAREHNLKNIDIKIPRNKLIVITGLSGSGKSSLAFDTLYAEGQRRYVESLSSYARQFLGRMNKPDVDFIRGIPPAIAIEQKVNSQNPRSTVGTSTEIYDYLKLLYARIGKTISPFSGKEVKKHEVSDVADYIYSFPEKTKILIGSPLNVRNKKSIKEQSEILLKQGYSRIEINGKTKKIEDFIKEKEDIKINDSCIIVVDRFMVDKNKENLSRISDSVQTALYEGHGECIIKVYKEDIIIEKKFSNRFEENGISFEEPSEQLFSFNNPLGACPVCEGYGSIIGIDESLVVPNKSLSVYQDAVACWKGETMKKWKEKFIQKSVALGFPIHKPYFQLSEEEKELLWKGKGTLKGINAFFDMIKKKGYKIQYRVMLSRFRGKTICPECKGSRLRKEAGYVKIDNASIKDLIIMPADKLCAFFKSIKLSDHDMQIASRILTEINNRLEFLCDVGLGYLTLNRISSSLSGGESQRINLVTALGSCLVGSLYILDEPSIGLHPKDTDRLINVLRKLQKIGNTVIVVEHDEEIIREADQIIDIGPAAGIHGGELVFQGDLSQLKTAKGSLTADYITGRKKIEVPSFRRKWTNYIEVIGARENNLKNIDVKFPLNILTVVTGVSGSGKSTLVSSILHPGLSRLLDNYLGKKAGAHEMIKGDFQRLSAVEFVDQHPIGKSSRSNPVTYLKIYDDIRKIFARQPEAKRQRYTPAYFSFNVEGGRCEECQGEGEITIEMQFMANIHLVCESCHGKRFKEEILEIKFRSKNIYDVLQMTVNQAVDFFGSGESAEEKKIAKNLKPLQDVGLGYIRLGQNSSTLSGGESQRVKLASFLSKETDSPTLFIFDEPTTGLHFDDIKKLMASLNALISRGHSVLVIEHNLDVIKCADWVIDLGPEGGEKGGNVVFQGKPEDLIKEKKSYTGKALAEKLQN